MFLSRFQKFYVFVLYNPDVGSKRGDYLLREMYLIISAYTEVQ